MKDAEYVAKNFSKVRAASAKIIVKIARDAEKKLERKFWTWWYVWRN